MTFEHSTGTRSDQGLISSRAAFPASRIPSRVGARAREINVLSGQRCLESFAKSARAGSWARTFAGLLLGMADWRSSKCILTWKLSATRFSRFFFQLAPSMRRTEGNGSGSSPAALPTSPSERTADEGRERGGTPDALEKASAPPICGETRALSLAEGTEGRSEPRVAECAWTSSLRWSSEPELPIFLETPLASDGEGGVLDLRIAEIQGLDPKAKLRDQIPRFLSARTSSDVGSATACSPLIQRHGLRRAGRSTGCRLQPAFALWMMGFPEDWCDFLTEVASPVPGGAERRSRAPAMPGSRRSPLRSSGPSGHTPMLLNQPAPSSTSEP